jgi:hypothetical protein
MALVVDAGAVVVGAGVMADGVAVAGALAGVLVAAGVWAVVSPWAWAAVGCTNWRMNTKIVRIPTS